MRDWRWLPSLALAERKHELVTRHLGGFVLFAYGIVPTFQPSHFHRIYSAYGGIFIVMALVWGWLFLGTRPDMYDIIGASVSLIGVAIIFYMPRRNEVMWKEGK